MSNSCLVNSLKACIGQTITVFTSSGGLSGDGFTGVLASVDCGCIKLIVSVGAPPACPIGSSCSGFDGWGRGRGGGCSSGSGWNNWNSGWNNWNSGWNNWSNSWNNWGGSGSSCDCGCGCGCCKGSNTRDCGCNNNWMGSVCEIPICQIVCFARTSV
ncbi:hypothetical protein [Anaeropeptidivorans aminofermentans]|uniref:hypothetical protein n=1 Tax=Anaeropeptidivorans aminofermentans TaxID=2934315 RepID=UPI0020256A43|nr:hypothetical protein [Anaeropeptidivorans aminofermentans]